MGFYKLNDKKDGLLYAAVSVVSPAGVVVEIKGKDKYKYPVDGWRYFDEPGQAYAYFDLPEPMTEEDAGDPVKQIAGILLSFAKKKDEEKEKITKDINSAAKYLSPLLLSAGVSTGEAVSLGA